MVSFIIQCKRIFDKFRQDEVTVYAAQASFFIVIAFFPFIMLLLTLIQVVPGVHKSDLLTILVSIMPDMNRGRSLHPVARHRPVHYRGGGPLVLRPGHDGH